MASYNKVILIGRVTAEPEMRYTASGKPVANFTLAVDRPRPNAKGEREADFINIVAWQKLAEICSQYLTKGKLIAVDGRLQTRQYENNEGRKVKVYEVVADVMQMLDRGKGGDSSSADTPQPGSSEKYAPAPPEESFGGFDTEELPI